ncbi:phytoene desaturase family protein [Mucisphaera calidilacus]|uniref:Diapolycopene oxygenase n=1 Tax=Mucisphaera calidilacus TaxID=2527982 RepID=A0A518BUZ1_9BACT|nr:phytoene desaturase family protein [Mucisphaera calidilacus]QDU70802.1 Diapolycopene oxygenase [Mucisphaera calidilacus]
MIQPIQTDDRVVVIGAGLGGLAAACTLAARGHRVTIIERNEHLGGKAAVLEDGGYRFDMGPTILTLPEVLERIAGEAGRKLSDLLDLVKLEPQWRCFFDQTAGGGVLDLFGSNEKTVEQIRQLIPGENAEKVAAGYEDFIDYSRRLRSISDRFFFWKPIGGLKDMFETRSMFDLSTLKDVFDIRMGRSVAGMIRGHVGDERVSQMLDHYTQYVGSSPFGSPAVLCGIAAMQADGGIWYPMGGTGAVPKALAELAQHLGVEVMTGAEVSRIETHKGHVTAVELESGQRIPARAVVSNMDSVRTHRELIGGDVAGRFLKRRQYEPACSGVVLYLGLDRAYDHLAHHNFVFSRDAEEEFDAIYHKGQPAPDPTCYLAAPAQTEPAVAPEGGDALYVLVHTPHLRDSHDWRRDGSLWKDYRETILRKLETTGLMPDIRERIVVEHALSPQDIHDRYHVLNGAIYGLASHGKFLGAFKPSNRSPDIKGLYLAGGAAHPGPGMPMVLMSGWIAADALDKDAASPRVTKGTTPAPELTETVA